MTEIWAERPPENVVLEFVFDVEDAWRDLQVDLTGVKPAERWHVRVPLKEIPDAEMRRRLRTIHAEYSMIPGYATLPAPTDDIEALVEHLERWAVDRMLGGEGPADHFADEMDVWIQEHGSDRLRTARSRGYKVNRTYAVERAAHEYPGFWVDTSSSTKWRERVDPSLPALRLEGAVNQWIEDHDRDDASQIVWLIDPPRELEEALEESGAIFENQEAIAIFSYLRRYDLYLPLDSDLRRESDSADEDTDA